MSKKHSRWERDHWGKSKSLAFWICGRSNARAKGLSVWGVFFPFGLGKGKNNRREIEQRGKVRDANIRREKEDVRRCTCVEDYMKFKGKRIQGCS